ncbi:hypothetical protein PC123_g28290 [Phytophthora cactorum]|nr:hypothetical protein PC123_g28290 [Phytophthora cactorum]
MAPPLSWPSRIRPARSKKSITSVPSSLSCDRTVSWAIEERPLRGLFLSDGYSNVSGPVEASVKLVREGEGLTTELMDGVKPDIELDEYYAEAMSPRPGNNEGL